MFRSRFFWKLYASYAALVLVTSAVIGLLVHQRMEQSLVEQLERGLQQNCIYLAPHATAVLADPQSFGRVRDRLLEGEARVTLIEGTGRVIVDTHHDGALMENHARRPEVVDSLTAPFGTSRRTSATLGVSMLYVAKALRSRGQLAGWVRVAIPTREVDEQLGAMRARIVLGAAVGALVALFLGLLVARRITAPIAEMTRTADALRSGRYDSRVTHLPTDEVGMLGDTLNRLGAEVAARIARISRDDAQLRGVLGGMVEAVIAVNDEDRVLICNRAACDLLVLEEDRAVGSRLWEIARVVDFEELITEARASRTAVRRDLALTPRASGERQLQAYATPFRVDDRGGVVIVLHDVTELRRLEGIRRDFVANVSHELETPLTSIRGFVETLLSGAIHDQENNVRFLGKIDDNVKRLTHLVSDLLSLGRIESQGAGLTLQSVEWSSILRQAVRRHEAAARAKQIDCELRFPTGGVYVTGDPESMIQVVDNLIDNAIKYTPDEGRVTLALERLEDRVALEVSDTGIGIPPEDLDRVFERFYRVDKARSRELGGTGLGLAIVKHLVQAMHGEVAVESELGHGTTFRVWLPASVPGAWEASAAS